MAVLKKTIQQTSSPVKTTRVVDDIAVRSLDSDSEEEQETKQYGKVIYGIFAALIVLGIVTGYILSRGSVTGMQAGGVGEAVTSADGKTVGVSDTTTFKDSATGTIQAGGLDGEGTHQLVRDGGPSQTVYLISSVVDLDQFIDSEVTVWGQTMSAKKAAWLMDVGKVEQK